MEVLQLHQRVDWLLRKMFGRSSEKSISGQLSFDLGENGVTPNAPEAPLEVDEVVQARAQRKRGKRMELPADLPVVEERIIPEEVQAEPEAFRQISEEIFEQLDIVPAQCFKRRITAVACMAHARRNFYEARSESKTAQEIVDQIAKLYQVETKLRENPKQNPQAVRQKESVPVLEKIYGMLMAAKGNHLPKSLTGKAIDYALARWDQLTIYTEHAELEIDNNPVENAIRPTAVGKKNWLFFGSAEAGQTSAIFYSLFGSCKALGLIPEEYLKEVFSALPEMTNQTAKQWTPAAWKARREKTKD